MIIIIIVIVVIAAVDSVTGPMKQDFVLLPLAQEKGIGNEGFFAARGGLLGLCWWL